MSDSDVNLSSASSTESCDTSYTSSRVRFSPAKENRVHQTKISTKTDKDGFSPAVLR